MILYLSIPKIFQYANAAEVLGISCIGQMSTPHGSSKFSGSAALVGSASLLFSR